MQILRVTINKIFEFNVLQLGQSLYTMLICLTQPEEIQWRNGMTNLPSLL